VKKENFCKDVIVQAQKKNAWMTMELKEDWPDVGGNVGLVRYQSHRVHSQWMHFMAI
jgi:hypothetical protein